MMRRPSATNQQTGTPPMLHLRLVLPAIAVWVAALSPHAAGIATAQTPPPTTSQVPPQTARSIRFTIRPTELGDQMAQEVRFHIAMQTTAYREKRPVGDESTEFTREQRRFVTARGIRDGTVVRAEVRFDRADETVRKGNQQPRKVPQSVAGKTYNVAREGDSLAVTDGAGQIPPFAEYEVVQESMESLGRPNPIAQFLGGRQITIGQSLALPKELALSLFGVTDQTGEVTRFDMTLQEVRDVDGHTAAVFATRIEARAPSRVQMGMQIDGSLVVETATCRTLAVNLAGPVGLSVTRGPAGARTLVTGRGKIEIALASRHRR